MGVRWAVTLRVTAADVRGAWPGSYLFEFVVSHDMRPPSLPTLVCKPPGNVNRRPVLERSSPGFSPFFRALEGF